MKMFWAKGPNPGNVGDLIGPYLYEKDTGQKPEWDRKRSLIVCGSIARFAQPNTTVWGAGCIRGGENLCTEADWRMVRGPRTRDRLAELGVECNTMADPALFLPFVYPKDPDYIGGETYCCVPHYVDLDHKATQDDGCVSPVTDDVEGFIDRICMHGVVMSSSLHGIIIAHAYGIPAMWVEFSDGVVGEGWKFRDYFDSIGVMDAKPMDLREEKYLPFGWHVGHYVVQPPDRTDLAALWETRPWNT